MHVLLLTENPSDPSLFQESIANLGSRDSFSGCESVAEVWAKLTSDKIPLPNVIFVDYELSASYGHQLLEMLKDTAELSAAPVIVMADSADKEDVLATYESQAACFVVLPEDWESRQRKIQACLEFWGKYAELPQLRRWWGPLLVTQDNCPAHA
jgi:two-component system, chemotaxis family, response regulator Rcp1